MSNPFWSIDDYINSRCAPDEDFTGALAELRERLLLGNIEMTGWRCSWDARWREGEVGEAREIVPALGIVDLEFGLLRDEFVLLPLNRSLNKNAPHNRAPGNGIVMMDRDYAAYGDGVVWTPITRGWRDLRFRADEDRAILGRGRPEQRRPASPRPEKLQAWFDRRVDEIKAEGGRWSREKAYREANLEFKGAVRRKDLAAIYNVPFEWELPTGRTARGRSLNRAK